jgi:hypothetical protein
MIKRLKDRKIERRRSRCEFAKQTWQSQSGIPRFTRNGVCNLLILESIYYA